MPRLPARMPRAKTTTRRYRGGPTDGDLRREQLLAALERLLETEPLADISVARITEAAGVSRPAFYFYFPTKAAAVSALLTDMYEGILETATWFDDHGGDPLEQLHDGIQRTAAIWRQRPGLMVAMLDAVGSDPEVRAIWEGWITEFEHRAATRLDADRARGIARTDIEPATLARVLVGTIFRAMESDVRDLHDGRTPPPDLITAIYEVWRHAAYTI